MVWSSGFSIGASSLVNWYVFDFQKLSSTGHPVTSALLVKEVAIYARNVFFMQHLGELPMFCRRVLVERAIGLLRSVM